MVRTLGKLIRGVALAKFGRCVLEVGTRTARQSGQLVANQLDWEPKADLGDMLSLRDALREVPAQGWAIFDVYVYQGPRYDLELITNMDVWFCDGKLVAALDSVVSRERYDAVLLVQMSRTTL